VTGHRRGDRQDLAIPVPAADTIVYYMGMDNLATVVQALLEAGRPAHTPVAIIHRGTTPRQRTLTGTLADINARVKESGLKPPAVIVVGQVVAYRSQMNWYEQRPLFGTTILITRPAGQAPKLAQLLADKGASVVSLPAIAIEPLDDYALLERALANLAQYQYLVFTSVNGVAAFFERLGRLGRDARALSGLIIAGIGPATAAALADFGIKCDLTPERFVAESLLEVFPPDLRGKRVLIPRAVEAREVLPEGLRARGAVVDVIPVYRTVAALEKMAVPPKVDIAVFTSSSAVDHFFASAHLPAGCKTACIGPITAQTLRAHGQPVDIEAKEHTIPGLVRAITTFFQERRS
jgi:uroporphyrinogen III methyltransferase/synthase